MARANVVLLAAIGIVLLLVSLPRLQRFALRENEMDALTGVRLIAVVAAAERPPAERNLAARVEEHPEVLRQLEDLESLAEGRLLRRHGYLFDLVRDPSGAAAVRAWPWEYGRSGLAAFVRLGDGRILGNPNRDGRWSGPAGAPELPLAGEAGTRAGWIVLRSAEGAKRSREVSR